MTHPKKRTKVRKPGIVRTAPYSYFISSDLVSVYLRHSQQISWIELKDVKKLHKWLGQAIDYLESKKE